VWEPCQITSRRLPQIEKDTPVLDFFSEVNRSLLNLALFSLRFSPLGGAPSFSPLWLENV